MDLIDLLEKNEAHQIMLLKYICDVGGSAKKQDIANYLQTGIYFVTQLIDNIAHLASKSNGNFFITVDKTTIYFNTKTNYSLNKLLLELTVQAPKYKILEELFLTGTTEPSRLCKKINISYSTYFRKINELNSFLSEFELTIQNGAIQGNELQIRYFFVSLNSTIRPDYLSQLNTLDPKIQPIIETITDKIETPLSEISKQKLSFYFIILKKRYIQNKNSEFYPLFSKYQLMIYKKSDFFTQLKKSRFYQKIQLSVNSFLNYYSFKSCTDEALLLILFLLGENISPINPSFLNNLKTIENNSTFSTQILVHDFFTFMKEKHPNSSLKPAQHDYLQKYLKSVIYRQLIFKGVITRFNYNKEGIQISLNSTLELFINHYELKYPKFFNQFINDYSVLKQLSYAIDYYEQCIQSRITVGVFIEDDFLYSKFLTKWWVGQVNLTTIGSAEEMNNNKNYDLIISNVDYPYIKSKGKQFLFITHQNEKMDLRDLEKVLTTMYLN